ncbi:DNA mismatch repair protein Mlh3 [Mixophyes fleayi]|uniref:DNA mismatch repair protein Mlh3 n=1 Tax=Mixophyes fleayi TaxID=3061075 RepID=UPI003F4E27FB
MIRALAEDVRCRLRSGVAITSVGQCVEELLLNSADAQASCIAVRVDLEVFKVQVVDNGYGLCPEDMKRVGMRYFTSKCHSIKDLEDLQCYGFRGEAIASLADVSSVVEICSKHKNTGRTFTKLFQNGKPLDVREAETSRPSAGTTITIYNLFYNLPVRRKSIDQTLELEKIRQKVEAVSLVSPSISFSLKNDAVCSMVLQLPKTKDVCSRFCQIYGLTRAQSLRDVRHTLDNVTIHGFVGCEGHYNRTMQFLYVNNRFVLKTRLHKLIDFILRKESIICRPKTSQVGKTNISPGRHRSNSDLYGMFVLNIQCSYHEYDVCFQPDKTLIEFQDWSTIALCVQQGIKAFLKRENLFLEASKDEITEFNQRHNFNLLCNEIQYEGDERLAAPQNTCEKIIQHSDLRSKPVCRSILDRAQMSPDSAVLSDIENVQGPEENKSPIRSQTDVPEQCVDGEQCYCPTGCVKFRAGRAGGQNVVTDKYKEEVMTVGHILESSEDCTECTVSNKQQTTSDSCVGNIQDSVCVNEDSLAVQHSPSRQYSVPHRSLSAESEAPGRNSNMGSDAGESPETAGNKITNENLENNLNENANDFTVHCSALTQRHLVIKDPISIRYKSTNVATKRPNPLKLHLPASLGSLDRFRRHYSKVLTSRGRLEWRPSHETSYPGGDLCQSVSDVLQNMTPAKTTQETFSPFTLSDYVSKGGRSSLTTKLLRLKENTEVEIPAGDLPVSSIPSREPSMEMFNQSTSFKSTMQEDTETNTNSNPLLREQRRPLNDAGAKEVQTDDKLSAEHKWLQCYEESLGKNVFINTSTGLSTYIAPTLDRRTACTKDVSNTSVTVVCSNDNGPLQSLYSKWKNPVFARHPMVAVDVTSDNSDVLAVKIHNILYPYRFTKEMVHTMKVVEQVDNKFIACLMDTKMEQTGGGNLLVLVDQHAAHERVRLEQLIADSFQASSEECGRRLKVSVVDPPLELDLTEEQYRLLRTRAGTLRRVGLSLLFPDSGNNRVLVSEIPLCFVEKEASETHRGRTTVAKRIVQEFLQEQAQVPGAGPRTLPGTVLRVLASQACHGAVKFNDPLSLEESRHLMRSLARCSLPFQCAHGRPAILPLADLQHMEQEVSPKPNLTRLRRQHRAWQLFGKGSSLAPEQTHLDSSYTQTCT